MAASSILLSLLGFVMAQLFLLVELTCSEFGNFSFQFEDHAVISKYSFLVILVKLLKTRLILDQIARNIIY